MEFFVTKRKGSKYLEVLFKFDLREDPEDTLEQLESVLTEDALQRLMATLRSAMDGDPARAAATGLTGA